MPTRFVTHVEGPHVPYYPITTIYSYAGDNDENFSLPISSFHYLGSKIQRFDLCSFVFFAFLVIKKKALSRNSQNFSKI